MMRITFFSDVVETNGNSATVSASETEKLNKNSMCDTDASQQNPSPLDENEEWEKVRIFINTSCFAKAR